MVIGTDHMHGMRVVDNGTADSYDDIRWMRVYLGGMQSTVGSGLGDHRSDDHAATPHPNLHGNYICGVVRYTACSFLVGSSLHGGCPDTCED